MSLDPNKLAKNLLAIVSGGSHPKNYLDAGKRWAHAYADYAKDALSFGIPQPPNSLDPGEKVLATFMTGLASLVFADPTFTAAQIANALTAFWLSPPVTFGTGVVTAVGGTQALAQALPAIWLAQTPIGDPTAGAKAMAAAMHAFTLTVVTTTPNPSGTPPVFVGPVS